MHLTWRWIEGSTNSLKREAEYFGINNLFDKKPPLMVSGGNNANTDTGLHDVLGRISYL